jgi:hypothetical protein
MKKVYGNFYIDTFKNLDILIEEKLSKLITNNIKHVINLTECEQLNVNHRVALTRNGIKSLDFFNDSKLHEIKRVPPKYRSTEDISIRHAIRERIVEERSKFLFELSRSTQNILFVCNRNNVLSPLFVCIMIHLRLCDDDVIYSILQDNKIVTTVKNKNDINFYIDKYIKIIYNKLNEISK